MQFVGHYRASTDLVLLRLGGFRHWRRRFLLSVGAWLSLFANADTHQPVSPAPIVIHAQAVQDPTEEAYYGGILKAILQASSAPGEVIDVQFAAAEYTQTRWLAEVIHQNSHFVVWTMMSKERELALHALRVPLFKGLLGVRALVVKKERLAEFKRVHSIGDLKRYKAGQASNWPDTEILKFNQLPVDVGLNREVLYKMLSIGRFDYFPRGLVELEAEKYLIEQFDMAVVPGVYLYYPADIYYFVRKDNVDLIRRMETGWQRISGSGLFDRLYNANPSVQRAQSELMKPHTIITLENPLLMEDTPVHDKSLWLQIK